MASILGTVFDKRTGKVATVLDHHQGVLRCRWGDGSTEFVFDDADRAVLEKKVPGADCHFWRTPDDHVSAFLELADVQPGDVVLDVGCGDGSVLIRAALERGASGIGLDISAVAVEGARRAAASANLPTGVVLEFMQGDAAEVLEGAAADADVMFLYTLPAGAKAYEPTLRRCLEVLPPRAEGRPALRVVSYRHHPPTLEPDATALFGLLRLFRGKSE